MMTVFTSSPFRISHTPTGIVRYPWGYRRKDYHVFTRHLPDLREDDLGGVRPAHRSGAAHGARVPVVRGTRGDRRDASVRGTLRPPVRTQL